MPKTLPGKTPNLEPCYPALYSLTYYTQLNHEQKKSSPHSLTMAALDDLPFETLFNIFSTLSCSDLASVSLVSRRLHEISEALLYRNPVTDRTSDWKRKGPTRIELFLRTLLIPGSERLAHHVRCVYLHWREYNAIELTPRRRSNLAIITAAESRFGIAHRSITGSVDCHVVLLLHLLPRLKHLYLMPLDVRDCVNQFFDAIGPNQPLPLALQPLTTFNCDWTNSDTGVPAQALRAILQLPNIRVVDVNVHSGIDDQFPADVRGTSGVTNLTIAPLR